MLPITYTIDIELGWNLMFMWITKLHNEKKKGCLHWHKLVVMLEQLSLLHCQCIQELLMFILKVTKKKEGYLIELLWHHSTVKVGPCSVMVWFGDAFSLEIISLTSYVIKKSKK